MPLAAVACVLLFLAGAAATVRLCAAMAGGMAMPGGWTLGMAWLRMPGQGWAVSWAMFAGTWAVMMVAMMLPSAAPALLRHGRPAGDEAAAGAGARLLLVAAGYFSVWVALGAAIYPAGALLAGVAIDRASLGRMVPAAGSVVLLLAGLVQLSGWKAGQLARCRAEPACAAPPTGPDSWDCCAPPRASATPALPAPGWAGSWLAGLRLGVHCALCCCALMAALLALGVMDLRAMGAIGAAITAERVLPWPERVARATGAVLLVLGAGALVWAIA